MRVLVALALVALPLDVRAEIELDPCACSPNKPGVHRAEQLTGDWGGSRRRLFEDGLMIHATYAGEIFAAPGLERDRLVGAGWRR